MPKGKNQKVKLIKILEILKNESDEEHPMSTNALIKRLRDYDIEVERKTLYDDIECLNECGYEIMTVKTNANYYYIDDRTFSVAELKILLDAVNASHFVTEKKTRELTEKIAALGGNYRAEMLKRHVVSLDTKHTNEKIYYNIDSLNDCIERGKKARFRYFQYNLSGKHEYKREGEEYLVSPINLICSEDNYYLVAYSDKYDNVAHYRVDRIDGVTASEEDVSEKCKKRAAQPKTNKKVFSMFKGEDHKVTLLCDQSLINVVVDRFGENAIMTKSDDGKFTVSANILVAPTFYSWVFTFGDKMKILSPQKVVDEMKALVDSVKNLY